VKQLTLLSTEQKWQSFTWLTTFKFKYFNHKTKQICIAKQFEDMSVSNCFLSLIGFSVIRNTALIFNFELGLTAKGNFFQC